MRVFEEWNLINDKYRFHTMLLYCHRLLFSASVSDVIIVSGIPDQDSENH